MTKIFIEMVGGGLQYIFFILFFFLPVPLFAQEPEGILPDNMMMDTSATVFEYRRLGITIVAPSKGIELLHLPNTSSRARELAEQYRFNYLLNASPDSTGATYRTGLLKIGGLQYGSLVGDQNRTHVVRIDSRSGRAAFIPRSSFISDTSRTVVEFQAGPLLFENGKLVSAVQPNSVSVPAKRRQTLLALIDKTEILLLVTREPYVLSDLAVKLGNLSLFKGKKFDVIALATRDSTALYSRNFPRLNLNSEARMPLLIGVR